MFHTLKKEIVDSRCHRNARKGSFRKAFKEIKCIKDQVRILVIGY